MIDEVLVLFLVFVGFLMRPDFLNENNVQNFTELILNQLVVHDVEYFRWQTAVFPVWVSLPVQGVWIDVLFNYFFQY